MRAYHDDRPRLFAEFLLFFKVYGVFRVKFRFRFIRARICFRDIIRDVGSRDHRRVIGIGGQGIVFRRDSNRGVRFLVGLVHGWEPSSILAFLRFCAFKLQRRLDFLDQDLKVVGAGHPFGGCPTPPAFARRHGHVAIIVCTTNKC